MTKRKRSQRPTYTSVVFEYLVSADEFVSLDDLVRAVAPVITRRALWATVCVLCKYAAVQRIDERGTPYFFATPGCDRRQRTLDQIADDITRVRKAKGNS